MTQANYPRIFTHQPLMAGGLLDLPTDVSIYLTRVLRRRKGNLIRLFNGRDGEWLAEIINPHRISTRLQLKEQLRPQTAEPNIHLLFSIVKRHRVEAMVEKACECGVSYLQPVISEFTQQKLSKPARLESILHQAAEQSERLTVPTLAKPQSLNKSLDAWAHDRPLLTCFESGQGVPIAHYLQQHPAPLLETGAGILIGPEGGFSDSEEQYLTTLPFVKPVTLGPRILKADTAAITALSLVQALWGDGSQLPDFKSQSQPL